MSAPAFSCGDELQDRIQEFIEQCEDKGDPIQLVGLAAHCGIRKATLSAYKSGKYDDKELEGFNFSQLLERFSTMCEWDTVKGAMKGQWKEGMSKMTLARHHGYTDDEADGQVPTTTIVNRIVVGTDGNVEQETIKYVKPKVVSG